MRRQDEMRKKDETKKSDYATADISCGTGLAGKICRHNKKKLNKFVEVQKGKVRKSKDFQETKTSVDSTDQLLAETTTSPKLIAYLRSALNSDLSKIPLAKGTLSLSQKEPGLYNGFFSDMQGQIVEKFDSQTIEIIAKNLQVKQYYEVPPLAQSVTPSAPPGLPLPEDGPKGPTTEQLVNAAHDRIDMMHNRMDQVIQNQKAKTMKIRFGDFELELRKSVRDFAQDFKKSMNTSSVDSDLVQKAIKSWRKREGDTASITSDLAAAKELLSNWDQHQEAFSQIVYALQQLEKDNE